MVSCAEAVRLICSEFLLEEFLIDYLKAGYFPHTMPSKLREWAEAHQYALTMMTNAAVHLARVPDERLEDTLASQRATVFVVAPFDDNPVVDNPSTAFRIIDSGFVWKNEQDFLKREWEGAQQYHRTETEEYRKQQKPCPAIVDPVLICFFLKTFGHTMFYQYHLYRARSEPMLASPHCDLLRKILEDTSLLCCQLMGTLKLVLREPKEREQPVPDVDNLCGRRKGGSGRRRRTGTGIRGCQRILRARSSRRILLRNYLRASSRLLQCNGTSRVALIHLWSSDAHSGIHDRGRVTHV